MSNHFPALPTDLNLQSVVYTMNFDISSMSVIPALQFTGVSTFLFGALTSLGNQGGVQFTFNSPGTVGSFDQDKAEAALTQLATAVFQLVAALTGQSLSKLAANFSVNRNWSWIDSSGATASYIDQMPYTIEAGTIVAGTNQPAS